MKPFTDEELSRVLSAHAGDGMRANGVHCGARPCLFQVKLCADDFCGVQDCTTDKAADLVETFDEEYDAAWTPTQFLRWLEDHGAA